MRGLAARLLTFALLTSLLAFGAVAQTAEESDAALARSRQQLDEIRQKISDSATLETLSRLRVNALAIQRRSINVQAALTPQMTNVDARLAGLGGAPSSTATEVASIGAERRALTEQRSRIDAQRRLARLLAIESEQAAEQIDDLRRARFGARLGGRTASILDRTFWAELRDSWPQAQSRVNHVLREGAAIAASRNLLTSATGLIAAALVVFGARFVLARLPALVALKVPAGRLRRSIFALAYAVLPALAALAIGFVLASTLAGDAALPEVNAMWRSIAVACAFGAYVASLGRALMSPTRPSWRLLPVPDAVALRLRNDPLLLGGVVGASVLLDQWVSLIHADLASQIAVNGIVSLVLGLLLVWALRRGEKARRRALALPHAAPTPLRSLWLLAIEVVCWVALFASMGCLLLGYVALGSVIVKQVAWLIIVASSAYILISFVDDACATWLGVKGASAELREDRIPETRALAAVLLSAATRLLVVVIAGAAMIGPLGQSPLELLDRVSALQDGISVGEMRILPGALVQALLIVGVGIWGVSAVRRWLLERLLPTTRLDDGMRQSVVTLLGWVAYIAIVALALSAIGLGLERVAWIASALSVGIGFGLRVFVQNFLAGLVLLTERPLSVGDLIAVDGIEGEVRRINLRTTELELSDHSSSMVPNFVFASKVVRNISHGQRKGWVEIRLPLPLDIDIDLVLEAMMAVLREHEHVLAEPKPAALVEEAPVGGLIFVATASISTPRNVSIVKSELLREIVARLRAGGVDLGRASIMLGAARAATPHDNVDVTASSPSMAPGSASQARDLNAAMSNAPR